jgi:hypothetical protein
MSPLQGCNVMQMAYFYRNVAPTGLFYQGQSPGITVATAAYWGK